MLLFIEQRGGVLRVRISAGCDESLKELGAEIELTGNFPKDTAARELFSLAIRECTSNCIRHAGGAAKSSEFTEAEMRVLRCLVQGMSYSATAETLGIDAQTVKFHVSNMLQNLRKITAKLAVIFRLTTIIPQTAEAPDRF